MTSYRRRILKPALAPEDAPVPRAPGVPGQSRAIRADPAAIVRREQRDPGPLGPSDILGLQKAIGNRALSRMLRAPAARRSAVVQRNTTTKVGDQTYSTSSFGAGRERTTQVSAKIARGAVGARGRTPVAMSRLHDPADPDGASDPLLGYDGGHVLGLSLGGQDASYNVVPMLPGFNRGTWKNVENEIEQDALWAYSGKNFRVSIEVTYASANDLIPQSVHAIGYADVVDKKTKKVSQKQVKDYGTKTQPNDIATTPKLSSADAELVTGTLKKSRKKDIFDKAGRGFSPGDLKMAKSVKKTGHFPHSAQAEYPDDPGGRPYEFLDILTFSGELAPGTTFGPRRNFTGDQRKLILQANMARNGGRLQSDDPNDPIYDPPHNAASLSERGAANFPEIDHIIPKSLGGSNWFSNARVVSWLLNNKEDRVKDISTLLDMTRLAPISMPVGTIQEKVDKLIPYLIATAPAAVSKADLYLTLNQTYNQTITAGWRDAIGDKIKDMIADNELSVKRNRYRMK